MNLSVYDSIGQIKQAGGGGAGGGVAVSAGGGLISSGTLSFVNGNGVTFTRNGQSVSASVQTNYLTTAMASNRGTDFVQATAAFAGTNASGTIASNGISVSVGNYITTAALSGDTTKYAQAWELNGNTAGTTSSAQGTKWYFEGGNSITVSGNSNTVKFSVGNYLTTAMASNRGTDFVQANATIAGTSISGTIASNGFSLSVGPYITTAMNSTTPVMTGLIVTGGTAQYTVGSTQTLQFGDSNGVSFGLSSQSQAGGGGRTQYVVTATVGTAYVGLNTAKTNVTWTVNSSGISLDGGGYAGTASGFTGANISGSITHNTAGLSLSLSVAAPGAAAENNWINLLGNNTAGNTTASGSTIGWSAGSGLTLSGTNGSQVLISVGAYLTTAALSNHSHGNPTLNLTNLSGTTASASNGFTLSLSAGPDVTMSGFNPFPGACMLVQAGANGSVSVIPIQIPLAMAMDRAVMVIHNSNSSNSSGQHSLTYAFGLYTQNVSTLSLAYSGSTLFQITHSGTQGIYSSISDLRFITLSGAATTMTPGNYWLGVLTSRASAVANGSYSHLVMSQANSNIVGFFNVASTNTAQWGLGRGIWSAVSATMPNSMAYTDLSGTANSAYRFPILSFQSGTV